MASAIARYAVIAVLCVGLCVFALGRGDVSVAASQPEAEPTRQEHLSTALTRWVSLQYDRITLGELADLFTREFGIAVTLDRRLNPQAEIAVALPNTRVWPAILEICEKVSAQPRVVGQTVLIVPNSHVALLRPLLAGAIPLAAREGQGTAAVARLAMAEGTPVTKRWEDATEPRELLAQLAIAVGTQCENPLTLPHDLWRGGEFHGVTPAAAMVCLLAQYDLHAVRASAQTVRLERCPLAEPWFGVYAWPVPATATVTRLREAFPDARLQPRGKTITVTGPLACHDSVLAAAAGPDYSPPPRPNVLLADRRFTLTIGGDGAPVVAVIDRLQKSGVAFVYDAQSLRAAGCRLDQRVNVDVQEVTLSVLLEELCTPAGLAFDVHDETVFLRPARRPEGPPARRTEEQGE